MLCCIQYTFNGVTYTSPVNQQVTSSPTYEYEYVHSVPCVDQAFLDYLQNQPLVVSVWVNPKTVVNDEPISTSNPRIVALYTQDGCPTSTPRQLVGLVNRTTRGGGDPAQALHKEQQRCARANSKIQKTLKLEMAALQRRVMELCGESTRDEATAAALAEARKIDKLENENAALKEELALLRGKMNLSTTLKCAGVHDSIVNVHRRDFDEVDRTGDGLINRDEVS